MKTARLNKNLFDGKNFEVVIIDVNSMFMFNKNPAAKLNEFITFIKTVFHNDVIFINVIDNGISSKMMRRFPYYKANRKTSKATSRLGGSVNT